MLCKHAMLIIWQLTCNVSMSCFFSYKQFFGSVFGCCKNNKYTLL